MNVKRVKIYKYTNLQGKCFWDFFFFLSALPERPLSWRERGRLSEEKKPYRICGSIICVHQQSRRGHWWGSTLQLEGGEVKRTGILGETVTPTLRLILHPWEQSHWDTMFFPLHPGLFVQRKSHLCWEMGRCGSVQVCPHNFVVLKLLNVFLCEAQTRLPGIWEPGASDWQRAFCCGATQLTMGCLWVRWLCFVFPSEIICSSALQREGKIMQCQRGNKVETV